MESILIPQSKGKMILIVLGAVAFVVASVWIWSIAGSEQGDNPFVMKSIAALGIAFFGACAIYGFIRLFDNTPGLIIDKEGIIDNSSAISIGRIAWSDITELRTSWVQTQRLLTIVVANPQKYIDESGPIKRQLLTTNYNMTGSPVNISSNTLSMGFDELVQTLTTALEEHHRSARLTVHR